MGNERYKILTIKAICLSISSLSVIINLIDIRRFEENQIINQINIHRFETNKI